MIYFIHGFEWPYDKENTIQINEYNQPDLKHVNKNGEEVFYLKEIIFPRWDNIDSFIESYKNKEDILLDKVIYKYEPSDDEIVWNYGLVFNDSNFWQNLKLSIDKIVEQTPDIRKIRIPFSLFEKNCQNLNCKDLLVKIYDELSEKEQFDFFIVLEELSEIHSIYDNFECSDTDLKIFDDDAKIISNLIYAKTNSLKNKIRLLKWKNIDLEIEEIQLYFVVADKRKFDCEIEEIIKEIKNNPPNLGNRLEEIYVKYGKGKYLNNYTRDIRNKVISDKYPDWINSGYIHYKTVLKYDAEFQIPEPNRSLFFSLFGYLPPVISCVEKNYGKIPKDVSELINEYSKQNFESKYVERKTHKMKACSNQKTETLLTKLQKINIPRNYSWTEYKLQKFTQKNRSEEYLIDRRALFSLVFALNLDYEKATDLFETSYCKLKDSLLLEDKILLCVLENFPTEFDYSEENESSPRCKIFLDTLDDVSSNF